MDTTSPASSSDRPPGAASQEGGDEDGEVHLRDHLAVVLARRWFLIAALALCLGVQAVMVFSEVPIYQATTLVLIEPKKVNVTNVKDLYDPTGGANLTEYYKTQHELIASRRIAEPVWRALGYDERMDVRDFMRSITVEPLRETRLVRVGFLSPDPQESARVSDAVVAGYVRDAQQRALGISDAGLKELRERGKELRLKLDEALEALEAFRRAHPELALDAAGGVGARLEGLLEGLARAQGERVRAHAELEALPPDEDDEALAALLGPDPEAAAPYRRQLAELDAERRSASLRLKPEHPVRQALEARIEALEAELAAAEAASRARRLHELRREAARSRAHLSAKLAAARQAEAALEAEAQAERDRLLASSRALAEFRVLEQAQETVAATYRSIMQRTEEIELAAATGGADTNVFVIDPAEVPTYAVRPNKRRALTQAGLLGLLLGVGLCFLVDYLDRSLKSKEDVERVLGVPVLGQVPGVESPAGATGPFELHAARSPRWTLAEAFRTIRTGVAFGVHASAPDAVRRLVVTSALPGDGKTLVAVNLAIALAQIGKRVLLVDADLRRPRLTALLGLEDAPGPGLSTLLAGEGQVEAVHALGPLLPETPTLSALPSGPIPPNPADLLNGERMDGLLSSCQGRWDWVILDAPPTAVADPTILSTHVGAVLFVVRSFRTPRELARRAVQGFQSVGARVVGVVLNQVDLPSGVGGSGYGYGRYGYGYGAYGYGYGADGEEAGGGRPKEPITRRLLRGAQGARTPAAPGGPGGEPPVS